MRDILLILVLIGILGYLVYEELPVALPRKRLCDYFVDGSVFENIPMALARGTRLLEVHVYSDEQDHPVVAKKPLSDGYDYAEDNLTFEEVCIDIVNDAFPSKDPMILSIVPHTDKTIVLDRVCQHLNTITRRHLTPEKDIHEMPVDMFANKLLIVSGGSIQGTQLEAMTNLNWNDTSLRRLTYGQAVHSRDEEELEKYVRDSIVLVAPEEHTFLANPQKPKSIGCQWTFGGGRTGFVAR